MAGKLAAASETHYQFQRLDEKGKPAGHKQVMEAVESRDASRPWPVHGRIPLAEELAAGRFYGCEIRTRREGERGWSKYTRVYFYKWADGRMQLVRVEREE